MKPNKQNLVDDSASSLMKEDLRLDKILYEILKQTEKHNGLTIEEFLAHFSDESELKNLSPQKIEEQRKTIRTIFNTDLVEAVRDLLYTSNPPLLRQYILYRYYKDNNNLTDDIDSVITKAGKVKFYDWTRSWKYTTSPRKVHNSDEKPIELYRTISAARKSNSLDNSNLVAVRVSIPHTGTSDRLFPILYAKVDKINQHVLRKSYVKYMKNNYSVNRLKAMNYIHHNENDTENHYSANITASYISK